MLLGYASPYIQIFHVSKIRRLDDWSIGTMGVVSSYIDIGASKHL